MIREFFAYSPDFTGGVYVAAGDTTGDGNADIITGPGAGGGPQVEVFSGATGALLQSFMAYSPTFSGGVRVGALTIDGMADIITSAGPGASQIIQLLNGETLANLDSFYAYDTAFLGGVFVGGQ
jgi:hypothetical protein